VLGVLEDFKQIFDRHLTLILTPQRAMAIDLVAVAAPNLLDLKITLCLQFTDDAAHRANRDPQACGDFVRGDYPLMA
jgi:hypothetical protein